MLGLLWTSACSSTLSNLDRDRQIWGHVTSGIADLGLAGMRARTPYSTPMTMKGDPSSWSSLRIVSLIANETFLTLGPPTELLLSAISYLLPFFAP